MADVQLFALFVTSEQRENVNMGVFHDLVTLVNRAPVPLSIRFDGQEHTLKPGENQVPNIVVPYAKNQNPIMGTHDPHNPSMSGGKYLVGVKGSKDECRPLTKEEWATHLGNPSYLNLDELFEGKLQKEERIVVRGRKEATVHEARERTTVAEFGIND